MVGTYLGPTTQLSLSINLQKVFHSVWSLYHGPEILLSLLEFFSFQIMCKFHNFPFTYPSSKIKSIYNSTGSENSCRQQVFVIVLLLLFNLRISLWYFKKKTCHFNYMLKILFHIRFTVIIEQPHLYAIISTSPSFLQS